MGEIIQTRKTGMTREKTGGHEKTTGEGSGKIRGQHTVVYIKEFTSEHTSVLQGPDAGYNIQNILICFKVAIICGKSFILQNV